MRMYRGRQLMPLMEILGFDLIAVPDKNGNYLGTLLCVDGDEEEKSFVSGIVNLRLESVKAEVKGDIDVDWVMNKREEFVEMLTHYTGQEQIPSVPAQAVASAVVEEMMRR